MVKQRSARLKVHEQVQVAAGAGLSPGNRAEHRNPASPVLLGEAEDLRTAAAQPFERQHLRHASKLQLPARSDAWDES